MQYSTLFLPILASLLTLVAGDACVAGGPENLVSEVGRCCKRNHGTWFQNFPNQAICVVNTSRYQAESYKRCVDVVPGSDGKLNAKCIPGDGGLEVSTKTTSADTERETITK